LREVLQAVSETPLSGQNNFIRKTESNFLIVVCLHFPHLSYRSRTLRVKTYRQQERRRLAEKIFSMNSPTPTAYKLLVDTFRLSPPFPNYLRMFGSAAKEATPRGEHTLDE
jgi:hypothetical protein